MSIRNFTDRKNTPTYPPTREIACVSLRRSLSASRADRRTDCDKCRGSGFCIIFRVECSRICGRISTLPPLILIKALIFQGFFVPGRFWSPIWSPIFRSAFYGAVRIVVHMLTQSPGWYAGLCLRDLSISLA